MDFETAMSTEVTRKEAQREIREHGCEWTDFVKDRGDR